MFDFRAFVETGVNLGSTTEHMATLVNVPIYALELDRRRAAFCGYRLRRYRNVRVMEGNSVTLLKEQIVPLLKQIGGTLFFYLDAHWFDHLPLAEEIAAIKDGSLSAIVMIDDFEVSFDPGYGFDDYGSGKRLCLAYLRDVWSFPPIVFFPNASAEQETGAKRGCVVFATKEDLVDPLRRIASLRPYFLEEHDADVVLRK